MSRSKLDPSQITQYVYDSTSEAFKVKLQDTDISMELSASDGDSITAHPAKLTASALGVSSPTDDASDIIPALDCSSLREVHVSINGTGTVNVMVSPNDSGSYFYSVGGAGAILPVCARRVKVVSVNANGDVHLVGRS